jgi:hypothetical protein
MNILHFTAVSVSKSFVSVQVPRTPKPPDSSLLSWFPLTLHITTFALRLKTSARIRGSIPSAV